MSKGHLHKCDRCQTSYTCPGEYIRNFDGFPPVVCDIYHQYPKGHNFRLCETCVMVQLCVDCGERPVDGEHDGDRLCRVCLDQRQENAS